MRKFIKLAYPNGKTYTYHVDDDVSIGDFCQIQTNQGAILDLEVMELLEETPSFETKLAIKVAQ